MGKEVLFWSIATLTMVPALLVASGYWSRGASIIVLMTGVGLAALLLFNQGVIPALVVIMVAIAGTEWRLLSRTEPTSNAISWGKGLFAALFCGVVGGALFAVIGSLEGSNGNIDKQQHRALPPDGVASEGTPFFPSRLFDGDMLLLWIIAAVAVVIWRIVLPARQDSTSTDQPNRHPLP